MYMMGVMFLSAMAASLAVMRMDVRTDNMSSVEAPRAESLAVNFVAQHQAAMAYARDLGDGGMLHGTVVSIENDILGNPTYAHYLPEYDLRGSTFTSQKRCFWSGGAPNTDCQQPGSETYMVTYGPLPPELAPAAFRLALGRVTEYSFSAGQVVQSGGTLKIRSAGYQVSHDGTGRQGTLMDVPQNVDTVVSVGDVIFVSQLR